MLHSEIDEEVVQEIKRIIEEKNDCNLVVEKSLGTYWIIDRSGYEVENEFRIACFTDYRIVISRVCFKNRRCETLTQILDILEKYGKENGFTEILIQSVETSEMMRFCLKNNFAPADFNIWMESAGVLIGDYILKL